jgi:hypothetical protein
MDKTKFTLGKFSFPVFFLQPTVRTPSQPQLCKTISAAKNKICPTTFVILVILVLISYSNIKETFGSTQPKHAT